MTLDEKVRYFLWVCSRKYILRLGRMFSMESCDVTIKVEAPKEFTYFECNEDILF